MRTGIWQLLPKETDGAQHQTCLVSSLQLPGTLGAEFLFMDDNARPHHANIVDQCLQSEDITRMNGPAYSPDLNPIDQGWRTNGTRANNGTRQNILGTPSIKNDLCFSLK
ncbi:DDE_3 domain-containing protein [Trichonephila clavipes]|nr:DDE_3 domain-containing protein [Trichonephila clavipes]